VDGRYLRETLAGLVRINSVNPSLVLGAPGEAEIASYVALHLRSLGAQVCLHEPAPGRTSVVGIFRGRGGGRSLMLNAHADTVGIEGMNEPFSAVLRRGRMYGRGSYDMKGSLAACLAAAKALCDAGVTLAGDLIIAAVADEEYASLGTTDLLQRYRPDGAIVTEPTHLKLCLAHKGFVWLEVEILGRAAHGSRFDLGVDANLHMGQFLCELAKLERKLRRRKPHPLVGPPSLHAALLAGGTGLSTYAARSTVKIERRTIPGETLAQVRREISAILAQLRARHTSFRARMRTLLVREPFEVQRKAAVVRAVEAAAAAVLGRKPQVCGQNPWMDAALLAAAGVETVVIGPAGGGAHATEEWVELESAEKLAAILARAAIEYCGAA
jgi:acetylornithine deacetylase